MFVILQKPWVVFLFSVQFFIGLILIKPTILHSQSLNQFAIFPSAVLYAHPNSNLHIYSDVSHSGTFVSYNSAIVNFYSGLWQNNAGSNLPDESANGIDGVGGVFRFSGLLKIPQRINTLASRPMNGFPNLSLDNPLNVTVNLGQLHVNKNLNFKNGSLILNNVDVNVGGTSGSGSITGFSQKSFIVTGSGMLGGGLIRNTGGQATALDFPIGTDLGSFTPLTINYKGIANSIKFRVANNIYNKINFPEFVNKTWIMSTSLLDSTAKADLTIQHNSSEEGIEYFKNRNLAYLSRYDAKLAGLWDILAPNTSKTPGSITQGASISAAYMDTRLNISNLKQVEYFSKSVIQNVLVENTPTNIPDAISPNGDGLNDVYEVVKRQPTDVVRFEVYSRSQVLVFKDLDYQNTFNGTGNMGGFMGNTLPDGLYYYLISVNGDKVIPGYLIISR